MTTTYDLPDDETGTPTADGAVTAVLADEPATPEPEALPVVVERPRALVPGTDIPIIPGQDEMRGMAALAVTLAGADAVPAALRGKPNDVFQVLLTARDLGVATTTAMREFHVIDGRVTLSPKVKLAMVNERGRHEGWAVWPDPANDDERATWWATRRDRPGITFRSEFSMTEARGIKIKANSYLADKDNWTNYPKRMLSWRALGYLLDDVFPEVGTGLYSPDEMGAMTDEDGVPVIDVEATEPLPGTRAPRGHHAGQAERTDPLDAPLAEGLPDVHAELVARLARIKLVESANADLRTRWQTSEMVPFGRAQVRHRPRIEALVAAAEKALADGVYGAEGVRAVANPPADTPSPIPDGGHPPVAPPPPPPTDGAAVDPAAAPAREGIWRDHDPECVLPADHEGDCSPVPDPARPFPEPRRSSLPDDPNDPEARARRLARAAQIAAEAGVPGPGALVQAPSPEAGSDNGGAATSDPEPEHDPAPTAERIEAVIAEVEPMDRGAVQEALKARDLSAIGNTDTLKRRLAEAMLTAPQPDQPV